MSTHTYMPGERDTRAFSLIELLTVIAIIAVLAAFLFPVVSSQRAKAQRNACASNLQQIAGGLRIYRLDTGSYPPALFGFVAENTVVPGLYPHWVPNREDFVCPDNPVRAEVGTRESMAMPGDEGYSAAQVHLTPPIFAPEMVRGKWVVGGNAPQLYPNGIRFPMGDSYDVSALPTERYANGVWERHYQRQWLPKLDLTKTDLTTVPLMGATPRERAKTYARQLAFRLPDSETVVTACTYHREYPNNWQYGQALPADSFDVVLFLDGHTEVRPSQELNQYQDVDQDGKVEWAGWQIRPQQ